MSVLVCRRLRMEIDLAERVLDEPELPDGYRWQAWSPELLDRHAAAKFRGFSEEPDARVFQSLREARECRQLMEYIVTSMHFLPRTTWLLVAPDRSDCGTIQGLETIGEWGAIQNVGVVSEHRGRGLGRALVRKALIGFQSSSIRRVSLEVTTVNARAIGLYESLGFVRTKTLFRDVS